MKKINLLFTLLLTFTFMLPLSAKITLPEMFSDNMVLQQQTEAPIWGKATPSKDVKIITSWDKQTYTIKADTNGKWKVKVKTPKAGGPYTISISDGKELKLNNVLIGEVWICSGQSNMEMPLAGWGEVNNFKEEIANANYPNIRLLHVEKKASNRPQEDVKTNGSWKVCTPQTVAEFSSVAYFFGRNLNENLNVPIGLINTSWGGTIAEAWTSSETLNNMPEFRDAVKEVKAFTDEEAIKKYETTLKEWNTNTDKADIGIVNNVAVWAQSNFDDKAWKEIKCPGYWEKAGLPNYDGIVWLRKTIEIPAKWAGKELVLGIGKVDDNEVTYFNGVKVGETIGVRAQRIYTVPGKLVKTGKAVITVRVTDTGGDGGIHGQAEEMKISLKSDSKSSIPLAGNWKYAPTVDYAKFGRAPQTPTDNPNRTSVLFNSMIHPLVPYAIQGAIWYQGESNESRAYQYRELFPLMIRDWRKQWERNLPFYFVQLANFREVKEQPEEALWGELREAQLQTLHLENTGMAVSIDIGDTYDIHPKNKQDVGLRLALNARAKTYGEKIPYSGPIYKDYQIEENKIRISFTNTDNGLKTKDGEKLKGFAICGPDHKFYWADAIIEGNEVVVSSPNVEFPTAVRYAWADNPICNLYNGANLPASPFRTDDWRR